MPRQIIDTESSRPAYIRRNIILAVVVAILLAAVLVGAYELFAAHHHASAGLAFIQGTSSLKRVTCQPHQDPQE